MSTFYPRQDWSGRSQEVLFRRDHREWVVYREDGCFDALVVRNTLEYFLKTGRISPEPPSTLPK